MLPAFDAIFEEHFSYVWGVLRRLGVRDVDAEDLAHEVFLHVHRRLDDFDTTRPVRPWLFGFAFRIASDHRRRARHRREVLSQDMDFSETRPAADDLVAMKEDQSLLARALDEVHLDRRAVLVMHEWDEVPITEVARALEIPLNTAYSRLRVARQELAAATKRLLKQRRSA